jgi:hypothetical protein
MRMSGEEPVGDALVRLCAAARSEVVLIAPFMKREVLRRMIEAVDPAVPLHCVTRWFPDEIVAGVSDLEVWPLLRERGRASLRLLPNLHAKYYRADDNCAVGSANLTDTALGWRVPSNLELTLFLAAETPPLPSFESSVFAQAVEVTEDLYQEFLRVIERLRELMPPMPQWEVREHPAVLYAAEEPTSQLPTEPQTWLPRLRHPELLFDMYAGRREQLTNVSRAAALHDLRAFVVPEGLHREPFELLIRLQLLQQPTVQAIDRFVAEPQRFGAVRNLLHTLPCAQSEAFDATTAWQTLMRWLLYFAGDRYLVKTPRYSEIFMRRGTEAK